MHHRLPVDPHYKGASNSGNISVHNVIMDCSNVYKISYIFLPLLLVTLIMYAIDFELCVIYDFNIIYG